MRSLKSVFVAVGGLLFLTGCAGMELQKAQTMGAGGTTFDRALYSEYIDLASEEFGEGDYINSDLFARKAQSAAAGETVLPEDVANYMIAGNNAQIMAATRERIMKLLDGGGRDRFPELAATVQAKFDCWVEEQAEGNETDEVLDCRAASEAAYDKLKGMMPKPKVAVAAPAAEPVAEPEPAAEEEPAPAIIPAFFIQFDFNSAKINAKGQEMINWVAGQVKARAPKRLFVAGHTDSVGSSTYNQKLSERRATAVASALVAAGVSDDIIIVTAVGEAEQRVATGDNVREGQNRVVQITLIK